jgi:DNA polymerase-3 subunit delta
MKLRPEQLATHLNKGLAPLYLVSGDEPLLLQEAAEAILQRARAQGFVERSIHTVESNFRWSELQQESVALSLFAEQRVVELRLPGGKPGKEGGAVLQQWCESPPQEKMLLIRAGKLDGAAQRAKWFKAIEQVGVVVQIWPLELRQIPGWIMQRMRSAGMEVTPGAAALIAERVEGNLLAAVQEIEKLSLLVTPGERIDEQMALQLVADSARFDPFQLADAVLAGECRRALRILHGLREEGSAIQVVLWAIQRDLRELAAIGGGERLNRHKPLEYVPAPLWKRRMPLFAAALQRLNGRTIHFLVRKAGVVDRAGKGMGEGEPWLLLEELVVRATLAR